jgi:hypothetical protein
MSLFDWLLVGHLAGDFLFQTDNMAREKVKSWIWLLRHVSLYMVWPTAVLLGYTLLHQLPLWSLALAVIFVFGTHLILDRRRFTAWWMNTVGIDYDHPWLPLVVDQVFHLVTLAIVAQALALLAG